MEKDKITPTLKPKFCNDCRYKLIHESKYKTTDPWMALEVTSLLTMVNFALKENKFLIAYGNDPEGINRIVCLGCYLPSKLKLIIDTAKTTRDLVKVKELGEA